MFLRTENSGQDLTITEALVTSAAPTARALDGTEKTRLFLTPRLSHWLYNALGKALGLTAEPQRFLKVLVPADAVMCGECPHKRWLPAGRALNDGIACNIFDEELDLDRDGKPKRHAKCLAAELAAHKDV